MVDLAVPVRIIFHLRIVNTNRSSSGLYRERIGGNLRDDIISVAEARVSKDKFCLPLIGTRPENLQIT